MSYVLWGDDGSCEWRDCGSCGVSWMHLEVSRAKIGAVLVRSRS